MSLPIFVIVQILLLTLALMGSAFFSATEMALLSANRLRVSQRAKSGYPGAIRAARLLGRREHLLVMFLIAQAALNVFAAALATGFVDRLLGRGWLAPLLVTAAITVLVVVTAEIVPKVIGKREGERLLIRRSRVLEFLYFLFLPLTHAFEFYIRLLLRDKRMGGSALVITREELQLLVREAESHDEVGHREKRMLGSLLKFRETVAREVMIPMNQVISVRKDTTVDVFRSMVRRHGFTRLPVQGKRDDRIVGVVNVFDLLYDARAEATQTIESYIREVPIVPDTKRIDHLLMELQKTRNPMCVVVDEFGSCAGILTVEDMVEEIMGEMADDHDRARSYRKIRKLGTGVYLAEGLADIDDVNLELGLQLPKTRFDTIGGLVMHRAGRVPREGEKFVMHGVALEVVDADAYGVQVVKITLAGTAQSRPTDGS